MRHTRTRRTSDSPRRRYPPSASSPRRTRRISRRSRAAGAERAGERRAHARGPRPCPRRGSRGARAANRGQRPPRLRPVMTVVPKRELGQHFLVDENILGVIGRLAELAAEDVVLEVGPGLGVLTGYLAARVARVHAVELDASLAAQLTDLPANVE